jgi:sugar lactone lactonase YvrE
VRAQCPNSIVAGPPSTSAGDGQQATSSWLLQPKGISLDGSGNLYIADSGNNRIREVSTDGVMHTVAGPDSLNDPEAVLAAPDGSVYIADTGNNRIRRITPAGVLTTVAGTGHPGFSGDNGAATGAELNGPTGMAFDAKGRFYFADTYNGRIRLIDANGAITTVAGSHVPTPAGSAWGVDFGDGGPATEALLFQPRAIAIAADGSIYILDVYSAAPAIRRVAPDGTISTLYVQMAATDLALLPDGSLLITAEDLLRLSADGATLNYYARARSATNAAIGPSGVYFSSLENVVYHAASAASEPAIFAGQHYFGDAPDSAPALSPIFGSVAGLTVGPDGSIWVADRGDSKIRKILPGGTERVVASGLEFTGVALDSSGNLYAATPVSVWRFAPDGTSRLFAGGGYALVPPVGAPAIPATSVDLSNTEGVVADSAGNVFVAVLQYGYQPQMVIARVTPSGQLTTIWDSTSLAGGTVGYPIGQGFAIDAQGYLVLAMSGNQVFRIKPDGSGIAETLIAPDTVTAVATGPSGEIFYVTGGGRIKALRSGATLYNRDVSPSSYPLSGVIAAPVAIITSVLISPAELGYAGSLATDALGNLYFSDVNGYVIRRFSAGPCFAAAAPQLSTDSSKQPSPITPLPENWSTGTTTSTTSTTSSGTSWFAPGELISLYGSGLGPKNAASAQVAGDGRITTQLAGTRVLFEGVAAPVLYASDGRVNTVIPFTMYGYPSVRV